MTNEDIARGHLRLACYTLADTIRRRAAQNESEIEDLAEKIYGFCMAGESGASDPVSAATTSQSGESPAARKR